MHPCFSSVQRAVWHCESRLSPGNEEEALLRPPPPAASPFFFLKPMPPASCAVPRAAASRMHHEGPCPCPSSHWTRARTGPPPRGGDRAQSQPRNLGADDGGSGFSRTGKRQRQRSRRRPSKNQRRYNDAARGQACAPPIPSSLWAGNTVHPLPLHHHTRKTRRKWREDEDPGKTRTLMNSPPTPPSIMVCVCVACMCFWGVGAAIHQTNGHSQLASLVFSHSRSRRGQQRPPFGGTGTP